jgi:hypothetical protein
MDVARGPGRPNAGKGEYGCGLLPGKGGYGPAGIEPGWIARTGILLDLPPDAVLNSSVRQRAVMRAAESERPDKRVTHKSLSRRGVEPFMGDGRMIMVEIRLPKNEDKRYTRCAYLTVWRE